MLIFLFAQIPAAPVQICVMNDCQLIPMSQMSSKLDHVRTRTCNYFIIYKMVLCVFYSLQLF